MAAVSSDWFLGEGRNADDEAFLAELRSLATDRGLVDVRPEDTWTSVYADDAEIWLVAGLDVPGLDAGDAGPQLQVGFDLSDPAIEPLVACWETHGYLLDQWESLPARDATPRAMAARAFDWMAEQLGRPVLRRDWARLWRRDISEWVLGDTDQLLWSNQIFVHTLRGVPRVTRLR